MLISCHFQDCNWALLAMSYVRSAIASIRLHLFLKKNVYWHKSEKQQKYWSQTDIPASQALDWVSSYLPTHFSFQAWAKSTMRTSWISMNKKEPIIPITIHAAMQHQLDHSSRHANFHIMLGEFDVCHAFVTLTK